MSGTPFDGTDHDPQGMPSASSPWVFVFPRLIVICKLCLKDRILQESHIIPEFLFKALYDEKHRFFALSSAIEKKNVLLQKGPRERLLCRDCEGILARYEHYAHSVLSTYQNLHIRMPWGIRENVDYLKFKVFQLSLLWRAGVSDLDFFEEVKLGRHQERLRQMILDGDAGRPCDYGALLFIPVTMKGGTVSDLIMSPSKRKIGGHTCYVFMLGSAAWAIFASSHLESFPFARFFLKQDGRAMFYLMPVEQMGGVRHFGDVLRTTGKLSEALMYLEKKSHD
jgi:hypothetical protein